LELVDQRRRDQVRRCRHHHFVERGVLGPAGIAVADADFDVGVALSFQPPYCPLRELIDNFDAVHPASQLGEYCGLIAEPGADFEERVVQFPLNCVALRRVRPCPPPKNTLRGQKNVSGWRPRLGPRQIALRVSISHKSGLKQRQRRPKTKRLPTTSPRPKNQNLSGGFFVRNHEGSRMRTREEITKEVEERTEFRVESPSDKIIGQSN